MGSAVWEDTRVIVENVPSSPLKNVFTHRRFRLRMVVFRWRRRWLIFR